MSGSNRQDGGRRKKGLSPEDRALWQAFSHGITPARVKDRVPGHDSPVSTDSRETLPEAIARKSRETVKGVPGATARSGQTRPVGSATQPPAPPAIFDRKTAKKLGKGRVDVDARIDLHGMRQVEAHSALLGFLRGAAQRGHRCVLVITGKGDPDRAGVPWDVVSHNTGRGVLRRNVPMWLASAEFRDLVVSFATAHIRHGGDGAFYVQIRRRPMR
ncbi:MAG: Smr/MutS family protein [Hyphomicrobiaceae bacterium]|nr:Smr/MutS family protein [Hyphomicrobiaceae bacterium]